MNALFVHGICGTNLLFTPTLIQFMMKRIKPHTFGYSATTHDFEAIVSKLIEKILHISKKGDYVIVGHSLGGVLVRAALEQLPEGTLLPRVLFLLGSPVVASQVARSYRKNKFINAITRDCGHLLSSEERMNAIPIPQIYTIAMIGTKGNKGGFVRFGNKENDGVLMTSEVLAEWYNEVVRVPVSHTLLPFSRLVTEILVKKTGLVKEIQSGRTYKMSPHVIPSGARDLPAVAKSLT